MKLPIDEGLCSEVILGLLYYIIFFFYYIYIFYTRFRTIGRFMKETIQNVRKI